MSDEPRYPIFHWASGLAICASLGVGFFIGVFVGQALS